MNTSRPLIVFSAVILAAATGEQLQSLVAPIALYPDPLLAEVLAACTYPVEAVEADRWLLANPKLQGEQLVQAASQQDWEPSIQALVTFPDVLHRISQNLKWSTGLGNAFLAQQEDVMAAIQAMRRMALNAGNLQSNSQQTVTAEGADTIVIQPADPQIIYVPDYDPTVLYGTLPYPYPVMAYPAVPAAGAAAAGLVTFGAGVALAAAFRGCCGPTYGWGWGVNWHAGGITVNNNFLGRYGYATPDRGAAGTGAWAHNPYYRAGAPYPSAAVADRYSTAAVRSPYGSAARAATPSGSAARTAEGPTVRTPNGMYTSDTRAMSSAQEGRVNAFSSGGAAETRAISNRGASSLRGAGGRRR